MARQAPSQMSLFNDLYTQSHNLYSLLSFTLITEKTVLSIELVQLQNLFLEQFHTVQNSLACSSCLTWPGSHAISLQELVLV